MNVNPHLQIIMLPCHKCGGLSPSKRKRSDHVCETCKQVRVRSWHKSHRAERKRHSHNYYLRHKERVLQDCHARYSKKHPTHVCRFKYNHVANLCRICNVKLAPSNWPLPLKRTGNHICRACARNSAHERYHNDPQCRLKQRITGDRWYNQNFLKQQEYNRERLRRIKLQVLSAYSKNLSCNRCGFKDIRALTIDHIKGNGAEHRRKLRHHNFYDWLIKHNFPKGYQVLCMNCQWIKRDKNKELLGKHGRRAKA